ncbi:glycosyltransferase family 2 protein [Novosphingobium sp. JCM 18896]|uniref:glycosyltransferase family 2 protein n=1 Tax=Novosphingobium sp. JCM 18896 TaxID=2989731 RepID=UPI00222351DC|nr:glycosyltransferase family 2 protein [Novosphingobium sp. JCM 18896]MCW1429332.1 glycosyltransferase family 2 protein [Novosphingobium sp. JCM 18896]
MRADGSQARPDISVVIPCYNEEENAAAICAAAIAELEPRGVSFEIVMIDNDSRDRTVEIIREICARDPRVRLIVNTRNFGQMRSPTHAIYQCRGRAVIGLCADFQDPPEMIPQFIERWRAGADIVLGVRQTEDKVGFIHGRMRALSYWLANKFGDYPVIPNATGFGLYDARVVEATRQLEEPEPFFRGMLVETGFKLETIGYVRPPRAAGESKNDFFALLEFAISSLTGASKRLLRVPMYIGAIAALLTVLMLLGGIVAFFLGRPIAGWFIAAVVQAQFALLFGFLGLLGDNVRIISERTRRTPLVIERERINFTSDE